MLTLQCAGHKSLCTLCFVLRCARLDMPLWGKRFSWW